MRINKLPGSVKALFVAIFAILATGGSILAAEAAPPEAVNLGRGAWGRITSSGPNQCLLVVTRFSNSEPSRLEFLASTNAARSWQFVAELRDPGRKLDNGHLLSLSNGVVLLTGRSLIDGQSYHLPVYASGDGGRTWRRLGNVDASEGALAAQKRGLWEPFLFFLPDGRASMIYSNEKHGGYSQVLSQKTSEDGGRTWGPERRIVEQPDGGKLRPGMGVVARMSDGRFFLVYEVVGMGRGLVHYKISCDGIAWPEGLGTPIPGHEAAPFVAALADGRLLLTSCSNMLSVSEDWGRTWKLLPASSPSPDFKYNWPALYESGPNQIVTVISEGGIKLRFWKLPP